jgi:hypothetical protein
MVNEEGIEIEDSKIKMDLGAFAQSIQEDERQFDKITAHINPQVSSQLSSRATKDEVQAVESEVTNTNLSKIPLKYKDYSDVLLNAILSLANNNLMTGNNKDIRDYFFTQVKEELSDIKEDLQDEEVIKIVNCVIGVKFTPAVRDTQALQQAIEAASNSEEKARLQKMYFMALGFSRKDVEDFLVEQDYGEQVSIAALENNAFKDTMEVAFGPSQDHITHMDTHFAKMDRVLTAVQQGAVDPMEAFKRLSNGLTNTQQHVAAIENSYFYKDQFKTYDGYQQHFTQKTKQLSDAIIQAHQQQQQQQAQQPQYDPKVMASIQNDRIKMQDKIKRTNILTNISASQRAAAHQQKLKDLQDLTNAKIQSIQQQTQAKLGASHAATAASVAQTVTSSSVPQVPTEVIPNGQPADAA